MEFSLSKWHSEWEAEADKDGENAELYLFGVIVFEILDEIRNNLFKLYEKAPKISNTDLIKIYFSVSNRDRAIISKSQDSFLSDKFNLFSITLSNGLVDNELTLQEIADNCVDGLEKAIFHCIKRIQKGDEGFTGSESSVGIMEFITMEASLSQLYGIFESYWQALLWGEYRLLKVDASEKVFMIEQKNTISEICAVYSQIRKQKLEAQNAAISGLRDIKSLFNHDRYILSKRSKKKKIVLSKPISAAADIVSHINSGWRTKEAFLDDEFPKEVLTKELEVGFSISEALDVFRCLMLLSNQLIEDFPSDDSAFNPRKLKQFCPKIGKFELKRGLSNSTQLPFDKISRILKFISYEAKEKEDLWCNPIVEVNAKDYILLTSSLVTPSITRVVEHWMVQLGIELQK